MSFIAEPAYNDTSSRSATTRSFCSTATGTASGSKLRPGNVHNAEDWDELLLPEIEGQRAERKQVAFRADAALELSRAEIQVANLNSGVRR